jgi:hypothetical protein
MTLVRSEGVLGSCDHRALEIMDNAIGCQQEGLSLERCTGVHPGVGAVGTACLPRHYASLILPTPEGGGF